MADFRIQTGFVRNKKTKRLMRHLKDGLWHLLSLWDYCTESQHDGNLAGMSNEEIADACQYTDNPDTLVNLLVRERWIDGEPGAYVVHDWSDWQPWVIKTNDRKDASVKANASKSAKLHNTDDRPGRTAPVAPPRSTAAVTPPSPALPSPPCPSPSEPPEPEPQEHHPPTPSKGESEGCAIRLDQDARAFVNLPDGYLDTLRKAYPGLTDIERHLAETAAFWSDKPRNRWRKDWNLTIRGRLRELTRSGSKTSYPDRANAATRAWVAVCKAADNADSEAAEAFVAMLPDIDPASTFALSQWGGDSAQAIRFVSNNVMANERGTLRSQFVAAHLAYAPSQEATP